MKTDWAEQAVQRALGGLYISMSPKCMAALLRTEHRRAVRVVNKIHPYKQEHETDYAKGFRHACADILAALKKGRT